jgi:septal ring factor EnvC (AmiA/AmiB activator)
MLETQIANERDVIGKTIDTVSEKLVVADATRLHRVRAAMRAIEAPRSEDASEADRMAAARRRAAARMLLERDAAERGLLADELARLRDGETRIAAAADQLVDLVLPASLARPVAGSIARGFGPYEHDRSHATLVRRGIDFEVEDHAPVVAPADGIVRYAGPIRGLDHGAILDHGTYYTVVAKLGELALPIGAHVATGDRLGRAAHHRVYLEVRVKVGPGGLPIDPEPLLAR